MKLIYSASGVGIAIAPETTEEANVLRWLVERLKDFPVRFEVIGRPLDATSLKDLGDLDKAPHIRIESETVPYPRPA